MSDDSVSPAATHRQHLYNMMSSGSAKDKMKAVAEMERVENAAADITAEKMAAISEAKAHERAQYTIAQAAKEIVMFAESGSVRCYHETSNHPDVAAYFRDRGFKVTATDPQPGILIEW